MNEQAGKAIGGSMAAREKYWEEQDAAEKLEALRRSLIRAYQIIDRQSEMLVKMEVHEHGSNGRMTVPFTDGRNELQFHRDRVPHELRTERERGLA